MLKNKKEEEERQLACAHWSFLCRPRHDAGRRRCQPRVDAESIVPVLRRLFLVIFVNLFMYFYFIYKNCRGQKKEKFLWPHFPICIFRQDIIEKKKQAGHKVAPWHGGLIIPWNNLTLFVIFVWLRASFNFTGDKLLYLICNSKFKIAIMLYFFHYRNLRSYGLYLFWLNIYYN